MLRFKRLLVLAGLGALVSLSLAGCFGGSDDNNSSTVPTVNTPTATTASSELLTTDGFSKAFDAVKGKIGPGGLLKVSITSPQAEFQLRQGKRATGVVYTAAGKVEPEKVDIVGPGSVKDNSFAATQVQPAAIDKIIKAIKKMSDTPDEVKVTVMTLEKNGSGKLQWTINVQGGGRIGIVFTADPDGSNVVSPIAQANKKARDAGKRAANAIPKNVQKQINCIQKAGGDAQKIAACARQR